ncbi:helix-turn-helix domain-containing protein [Candidatus Allofournierella merdipullorum]|uniref:helix-turn-helix domain-containing protein n=1 Tax=Candidatus Allofournierella merdipullorum TaxID=2838595 RepID=UPI003AB8381D
MSLGENIARLRAQNGWSQGELADKLEVSRQSVSKWETDASVPDLDKLVKLSEAFGVSLDDLVHGRSGTAPCPAPSPVASLPSPIPAQKTGVSGGQKIAALVLFLCGLMVFFAFLFLGGGLVSLSFAAPFWLCAAICVIFRKHAGLWCGWAVYFCSALYLRLATGISWSLVLLTHLYEPSWNFIRLAVAWAELAVILVLLAVTVLRFRRLPLATGRETLIALASGWLGLFLVRTAVNYVLAHFFRMVGPVQLFYYLFGFAQLGALAVLLCFSARYLHSLRHK